MHQDRIGSLPPLTRGTTMGTTWRCLILVLLLCGLATAGMSAPSTPPPPEVVLGVSPYDGMFQLYNDNRARGIGHYMTVDFVLTAYSLFMHELLTEVEADILTPACQELTKTLVATLAPQEPRPAGHTTALAYVTVIARLLDPAMALPPEVVSQVQAELALIEAHQGVETSAVTGVREDFSQYVPRGRYTTSEALQRYFRALMYAGRVGFFLRASKATSVSTALAEEHTAAALLISQTIMGEARLRHLYERVQHLLDFFVGPSDDLTPADYVSAAGALPLTQARQQILTTIARAGRLPRLLSTVVEKDKLAPFRRTFLVHHMPGSPPTSPSKQSGQRELSHGLCPIPVRSSVWWDTSAGTITPALDLMQFIIDHAVTRVPHLP